MYIATAKKHQKNKGNIERCQFIGMFVAVSFSGCCFFSFRCFSLPSKSFWHSFDFRLEIRKQTTIYYSAPVVRHCTMLNRIKLYQQLVVCVCLFYIDVFLVDVYVIATIPVNGWRKTWLWFCIYGNEQCSALPIAQPNKINKIELFIKFDIDTFLLEYFAYLCANVKELKFNSIFIFILSLLLLLFL